MIFVCRIDGTQLGEFTETEFQTKISRGEFAADDHYWREGMPDWRPVSQYRLLAKTQRITFTPPTKRTMKLEPTSMTVSEQAQKNEKPLLARLLDRLRGRKL